MPRRLAFISIRAVPLVRALPHLSTLPRSSPVDQVFVDQQGLIL